MMDRSPRVARERWHCVCFFRGMLLPLLSSLLLFGGTFILLTRAMLLSVRTVVAITAANEKNR